MWWGRGSRGFLRGPCLPPQPALTGLPLCRRPATRRCRSPGSCTAATTPPQATCSSTWSGSVSCLVVTPGDTRVHAGAAQLREPLNSGFSPSSAGVHAVPAEWKVRQRGQDVQQVRHPRPAFHFLTFLIYTRTICLFGKTIYKQEWKDMEENIHSVSLKTLLFIP